MSFLYVLVLPGHHGLQLPHVGDKILLGVELGQPLVELLGLALEAGEDNEGGDHEDHGPHHVQHHRDAP